MMRGFREAVAGLEGRVRGMVARAIVRLVDDARQAQALQLELLAGESHDGVERFQSYGLTAHPHPGAEALVVFPGGLRSHGIALAVEDRRYRIKALAEGEVALFDDLGNLIKLGRERIDVTAVTAMQVDAPNVLVKANTIQLGAEGGPAVARVGDTVDLSTGKILTGSSKVKAA